MADELILGIFSCVWVQRNAKQAAEKRYTDALRGCGLSEDFVSSKVPMAWRPDSCDSAHRASSCSDSKQR